MTESEQITDQLERAFAGEPWYGSSVMAVLAGVSAETAGAFPIPGGHSIWELVLHMTGWKTEVLARFDGHLAGDPPGGDWPAQPVRVTQEGWQGALAELQAAHDGLVTAVRQASPTHLHGLVNDPRQGAGLTQWQTLHGVVQHDAYHLGQISLLRRAMGA